MDRFRFLETGIGYLIAGEDLAQDRILGTVADKNDVGRLVVEADILNDRLQFFAGKIRFAQADSGRFTLPYGCGRDAVNDQLFLKTVVEDRGFKCCMDGKVGDGADFPIGFLSLFADFLLPEIKRHQ